MDDRSERLRKRRRQSSGTPGEESEPESSKPDKQSETSKPDSATDDGDDSGVPIKEKQTGTYMYLPDSQVKELRRQYNILKAEYEFEYDEDFEKNRHFYPLVIKFGLAQLQELNIEEIRAHIDELYE